MTRINLVSPSELTDQHLLAEYREIRLLSSNLQRTLNSKFGFQPKKVPSNFTLNSGHCYFFYNKGKYIGRADDYKNFLKGKWKQLGLKDKEKINDE